MDISAVIVTVAVCTNNRLMSRKMLTAKLLAKSLSAVNRQSIFGTIARIKADYVVMTFDITTTAVFAVMQI